MGLGAWGYAAGALPDAGQRPLSLTHAAPVRITERQWLAEEDAYLRARGHTTGYQEMCEALGVCMADLKRRLRKLGISVRRGRPRNTWQAPVQDSLEE